MTTENLLSTENLNNRKMYQGERFESLKKTLSKTLLVRMHTYTQTHRKPSHRKYKRGSRI